MQNWEFTLFPPFKSEEPLRALNARRMEFERRENEPYRAPPAVSKLELRLGQLRQAI